MTIERIIELLEIEKECVLRNATGQCNRYCMECDLLQDDTELHEMYTDVIAMLKAQEPRVMTLEEVKMFDREYYYLESVRSPGNETQDIVVECVTWPSVTWARQAMGDSSYGKTWRCWTSRPTKEQTEATPWNAQTTDLVSRAEMLEMLGHFNDYVNGDSHFLNGIETAKEITENLPAVDAVPLGWIRAKIDAMKRDGEKCVGNAAFVTAMLAPTEFIISEWMKEQDVR